MTCLSLRSLLLSLSVLQAAPALADSLAGSYLAGRVASMHADFGAAQTWFSQALAGDPENLDLKENAILAAIGAGDFPGAVLIAESIPRETGKGGLGDLAILTQMAVTGDYAAALAEMDKGRTMGPLVDGFFRAWSQLGNGQMSDASAEFTTLEGRKELSSLALLNKALALASVGDYEGADEILSGRGGAPIRATRRSVIAHAEVLSQLERNGDAVELLDKTFPGTADARLKDLRTRLEDGQTVPFQIVRNANDGLAELFFAVASAVAADATPDDVAASVDVLLYARTALELRPDLADAALLAAAMLMQQEQYDLAITLYAQVPPDSPDYIEAELGRAEAMVSAGRNDAAIEALRQLSLSNPGSIPVWATLGDVLRRNDDFASGAEAYDKAIALIQRPGREHWSLFYARAICKERLKNWEAAEADFLRALELSPGQPAVLNYLGYSYLEMQVNLGQALDMIQRAARARPDDGAISDSLGWAYYRLGRYDEAEAEMERAIELMPVDAVVNDHLGDVYWMVGRKREAEFQWRRALSFEPETEAEADRIRRKLKVGLDAVLDEEGASAAHVTDNGG